MLEKEREKSESYFIKRKGLKIKANNQIILVVLFSTSLTLNKEFELNALKFSRNFEASALIKALNTGFAAESNLVWSTASQMPRSLSGNLTLDLFGQAINLVDFGGRMEGVEHLVKNVFGSYFADDKTAEEKVRFYKDLIFRKQ